MENKHEWISEVGGYSIDNGHWSYSTCKKCRCTTDSYSTSSQIERNEKENYKDETEICK